MNFTWKSNSTNSIIPTNSRPYTNNDENLKTISRTILSANPIKQWRKQLQPVYATKSSKQVSIEQYNAPTSVVHRNVIDSDCEKYNMQLLKENINLLNECNGHKHIKVNENNSIRCIGGSNHIKRSGSSSVSVKYYQTHDKYLKAKCKTHSQNSILGHKNENGTYKSTTCSSIHSKCNKPVIYKPSNKNFSSQGSVSSSAHLLRKKNNTITNNSATLKSAYGNTYVKTLPYYPGNTGYEIKFIKGNPNLTSYNKKCC